MPSTSPVNAVRGAATNPASVRRASARAWVVDGGTALPSSLAFHICLTFIRAMPD